jgi:hypothetical protein
VWKCESPDGIRCKLSELLDRSKRCLSAQRLAFGVLVKYADSLQFRNKPVGEVPSEKTFSEDPPPLPQAQLAEAKRSLYRMFEDYVDMHKDNAFRSAFIQPAKFVFRRLGDDFGHDHVEVHALNSYAGLLAATLQVFITFTLIEPYVLISRYSFRSPPRGVMTLTTWV